MNGYNFTERCRNVLGMARREAARLHHEYVGTEHILLALIHEGEGVGPTILANLGADADALVATIEETVKRGPSTARAGPDLPYTSRAKKVLELAMSEARELNHTYVGTEHLLLGLLREQRGIAAQVLGDAGVTADSARKEMLRILGEPRPGAGFGDRVNDTLIGFAKRGPAPSEPFPRFIERLRVVIAKSHEVAADRSVTEVTPAYLAIALLEHGEGTANAALDRLGFDRGAAVVALNDLTPLGSSIISPETVIGLSPAGIAAMEAMDSARREARAPHAHTQHLLIGLLTTSPEVARVFAAQGVTVETLREKIREVLEEIRAISG